MAFSITAFLHRLRAASKGERELWLAGFTVAFGLIVLPFFIYIAGNATLGPNESGGLGAYLLDFMKGLIRPHAAYWLIVLGPYLLIAMARGLWFLRKRLRDYAEASAKPTPPRSSPARRGQGTSVDGR
jgi:hypothetical protein